MSDESKRLVLPIIFKLFINHKLILVLELAVNQYPHNHRSCQKFSRRKSPSLNGAMRRRRARRKKQNGYGRSGTVFTTTQEYLWEHTNPDADPIESSGLEYLPPLVLKVADEKTYLDLGREAMNYELLRHFHGVSVPRFYGWFNIELEEGFTFPGVKTTECGQRTLSVLVLERMGERITMKESEEEIQDICDVCTDVAWRGIAHFDIRYNNLFQAPKSPPGYPNFEQAKKIDNTEKYEISAYHVKQVRMMYDP
ncbi:hypothetical protein BDQ17DRAFT_1463557 [Cyathus striatus]|nr:hypothetical protein BDQ17DRAFT_1463557 [Cyathus striatus]